MALIKSTLKVAIQAAFEAQATKKDNQGAALSDLADKLATAIDNYIKSGEVLTRVTGVCATPAGPGTIEGTGTGTIS